MCFSAEYRLDRRASDQLRSLCNDAVRHGQLIIYEYQVWIRQVRMPPFSMVLTPGQEISDDVEPCRPLVVGLHDDPGANAL